MKNYGTKRINKTATALINSQKSDSLYKELKNLLNDEKIKKAISKLEKKQDNNSIKYIADCTSESDNDKKTKDIADKIINNLSCKKIILVYNKGTKFKWSEVMQTRKIQNIINVNHMRLDR